jgi:hypothetical protein
VLRVCLPDRAAASPCAAPGAESSR